MLLAGLLGACASPNAPDGGAPAPTHHATDTSLTITVTPSKTAPPETWTLACPGAVGTLPKAVDACAFVAKTPVSALAPVPGHPACTMIFGGPQVATVTGTWRGQPVDARFARDNGCEVARWDKAKPLLGAAGA